MRALNPLSGEFYREALQVSRYTREMFCLMEGRHVHPSTLYPGGVGTVATIQLFTDYYTRLMRYVEFMKRVVPLHDDLFDFFYEAMPGYEEVGRRRVLLGCWGAFNDPEHCDFKYKQHDQLGPARCSSPPVWWWTASWSPTTWSRSTSGIRILLGSSFYEDWDGQEMFVDKDPLGNPVDRQAPVEPAHHPAAAKRDFDGKYSWVDVASLVRRQGLPRPGHRRRPARPAVVDGAVRAGRHRLRQGHRPQRADQPAEDDDQARGLVRVEDPVRQGGSRCPTRSSATGPGPTSRPTPPRCALHFIEKALAEVRAGRTKTWEPFKVPKEAISCGFTEAVRGVLSHHMVIQDGKIANYHPYPPTPWNGSVRDIYGTPGPYEDAVQNTPIFEENPPENFKGIDIMRAVRSFDPCLPCGVHMYLGQGKELERLHTPHAFSTTGG